MALTSRQSAENLIDKLREDNGGLSDELRERLERDHPQSLKAIRNLRRKLGASTRTLATNIYSDDSRFVYELIQNAEDNSYSKAASNNAQPFLHITLRAKPAQIVVDSNEDGFQREDVVAICSTSESSKKSRGYIGEKGIGFKSVFKIARRVQIQSWPFSFSFEYDRTSDDDGLGMVTPIPEPWPENKLPAGVQTRMTLTLLNPNSFKTRAAHLRTLPDTLLLFLQKLRVLSISIEDENGTKERIEFRRLQRLPQEPEVISKTIQGPLGKEETCSSRFLVVRRRIYNLPTHPLRKGSSSADVVLAFPIGPADEPVLQQQHVFAYLPLRQVGFKFLIQSDFTTQASREDVDHDAWNRGLLDGVAKTFQDAVQRFVLQNPLQYQWMRYLPDQTISDEFWATLGPKIRSLLQETPILRPWSGNGLKRPNELRYLPNKARDDLEDPLFADLSEERYLAKEYQHQDFLLLQSLGCKVMSMSAIIDRVEEDLNQKGTSRMRNSNTSQRWHARSASFLLSAFEQGFSSIVDRLRTLPLIPLSNASFVPAQVSGLYFQESDPCAIPENIDLMLISARAQKCSLRKDLFAKLGVKHCDPQLVIDTIYEQQQDPIWPMCPIISVMSHMHYLYHHLPEDGRPLDARMKVWAIRGDSKELLQLSKNRIYFNDSDDEYEPVQLFRNISEAIPGLQVWVLAKQYHTDGPSRKHGMQWPAWLEKTAGIRRIPPLFLKAKDELLTTIEFNYLANYRSEVLLELFRRKRGEYAPEFHEYKHQLQESAIRSKGGKLLKIRSTYAPLKSLVEKAHKIGLKDEFFIPVAELDDSEEWGFLMPLGVQFTDDLAFYVNGLEDLYPWDPNAYVVNATFAAYAGIEKHLETGKVSSELSSLFREKSVVLPARGETLARWVTLQDCRWSGPVWLTTKSCLKHFGQYRERSQLFRDKLKVKDSSHEDWLEELEDMKERKVQDKDKVSKIYEHLHGVFKNDTHKWLRNQFETRSLVYAPARKHWFPPSACVWAPDKTTFLDKASISSSFVALEDFFCATLGISKPSLQMRIEALIDLANKQQLTEIKAEMISIAALDPSTQELAPLRKVNMFPVWASGAQATLTNAETNWVIADREEYATAFKGQAIHLLDFSSLEIQETRKFLQAMGLKRKFMSVAVEEKTKAEGGVLNSQLTISMRKKAYAFYRCAVRFSSSMVEVDDFHLLDCFRNLEICESDHISKSIHLTQDDMTFTVERSRSNFHVEQSTSGLKFYVPTDKHRREVCYSQRLPKAILGFLKIFDPEAESVFKSVIGATSLHVVDEILLDEGVVDIEGVQRPSTPEPSSRSSSIHPAETPPSTSVSTPSARVFQPLPSYGSSRQSTPVPPASADRSPSSPPLFLSPDRLRTGYAAILSQIIEAAEHATIPNEGVAYVNTARTALGLTPIFSGLIFPTPLERDMSVGAAGEPFMFELFSRLSLPAFSVANWQSRIRDRVRVHDKYTSLTQWRGRETADLTYEDTEGALTRLLVELGYLASSSVTTAPKYYLEVKTTASTCEEPFYMSDNQYRMMQRLQMKPETPAAEVMIVLRVFNVDRSNIGLRLYVDPESHRQNGKLRFSAEKWVVRSSN